MRVQVVEPTKCIGFSSKETDTTLAIASKLMDSEHKFSMYPELWVDNGAFESGTNNEVKGYGQVIEKQIEIANNHSLCKDTKHTYFALPDVGCQAKQSINLYKHFKPTIALCLSDDVEVAAIPQGATPQDFIDNAYFYHDELIRMFGFSVLNRRWLRKQMPDIDIFEWFFKSCDVLPEHTHCLGFDLEDLKYKGFYKCHSVDTSYPYKLLMTNTDIGKDIKRPADYFERELDKGLCGLATKQFLGYLKVQEDLINM